MPHKNFPWIKWIKTISMARESQPPPPLIIQELQEKLDEAHSQHATLQQEYSALADALDSAQSTIAKVTGELAAAREVLREREAEIRYLQGQLEESVNECAQLKCNTSTAPQSLFKGVETPIKMVQDMKDRLKVTNQN